MLGRMPYLNVAAPAALVATIPPADAPAMSGPAGNHAPSSGQCFLDCRDRGTPASTVMLVEPTSRIRVSFSVERSVSPIGVAPPVSDDCAPIGRIAVACRTIAGISRVSRGTSIPAACPPGSAPHRTGIWD